MGTRRNPGRFDCFAAALPDEPLFVLLARDPLAPGLTRLWAAIRRGDRNSVFSAMIELQGFVPAYASLAETDGAIDPDKASEAEQCAGEMRRWRADNEGAWRAPAIEGAAS